MAGAPRRFSPRIRATALVILFAALGVGLYWTWRIRAAALETYVTSALDSRGTRIEVLIPSGWQLDKHPGNVFDPRARMFVFRPPDPAAGMPAWLRRILRIEGEDGEEVLIYSQDSGIKDAFSVFGTQGEYVSPRGNSRSSWRLVRLEDNGFCVVVYKHSDLKTYKMNRSRICSSLRVRR